MKQLLFAIITFLVSLVILPNPVFAQADMCNLRCEVDGDCGSGYRCYVGVCRLDACPSSASCNCAASTTTTPVPTATVRPTASVRPTTTASASPSVSATAAATLTASPKTGFEAWMAALFALVLFALGTSIASVDTLLAGKGSTPSEIVSARKLRKN